MSISQFQYQNIITTIPNEPHSTESLENLKTNLNQSLEVSRKQRLHLVYQNPESILKEDIKDEKLKIVIQNRTREVLCKQIECHEFIKLKLSNKDIENPLHSLFRWCILVMYKEEPELYNWSNFKEVVFVRDGGVDLKRRLSFMNFIGISKIEASKTAYLLTLRPKFQQLTNIALKLQVIKILDVIEIILKSYESGIRIKKLMDELTQKQAVVEQFNDELVKVNEVIKKTKESLRSLDSL